MLHKNPVKKLVYYLTLDFFNVVAILDLLLYNNLKWQKVHKSGVKSLNVENSVETVENYCFSMSFQQINCTALFYKIISE